MAYESRTEKLPPSHMSGERYFRMGFVMHGDISLSLIEDQARLFEDRSLEAIAIAADRVTSFGLAHGNEVKILASYIGYLRRLGSSEEKVEEIIRVAAQDMLQDDWLIDKYSSDAKYRRRRSGFIEQIVKGEEAKRYSKPEFGLVSLMPPTPVSPGLIERQGGTAFYTKEYAVGKMALVVARIKPANEELLDGAEPDACQAEFYADDIPIMARAVCELAMGEYRYDLFGLIKDEFPEI